ncbi:redoxin domain-containing protein [Halorussus aquaticus]|uniref:Redoxin domain-containing protein n=1 Tax=Halorussus aquaticus TaxID=2953748 RepID=A0ABD5Q938_9EURY|nr:redoxin domain-containing protein [Halorussus aquaticus]
MPDFDVVSLPDTDHVAEGDTAPDFTRPLVNDEYWEDAALSDLTDEGPVLLVFFTMDGAFPATYMWNEIRDRAWGSEAQRASEEASGETANEEDRDLTVVGLSISDPYAHKQLVEERGVEYRLFSDPQNGVAEEYGIVNDLDGMAGVSEPRPAVFLLDGDRTVEYAWVAEEWPDFPDYDEVEAAIESQ